MNTPPPSLPAAVVCRGVTKAFGDENSRIEANGDKYTINFKDTTTGLRDCKQNQIWVQTLASAYGLVFPQCPVAGSTGLRTRCWQ